MTPEEENEPAQEGSSKTENPTVLIRGADGALYLIKEDQLAPGRLEPEDAKIITEILEAAHENPVVEQLTRKVIEEIRGAGKGPSVASNTFINDVRRE
jgi:hypothetical protein